MRSSLFRVLTCAIALSMFATSSFAAIETNVSTVAELVGALNYINSFSSKDRANMIRLAPGDYDVSECAMTSDFSDNGTGGQIDKNTHLAMNYVTIVGATGNPRDTVIYGGGAAKSRGVICGRFSTVRDLTISNGWAASASGGGYCGYHSTNPGSTMRELVSNCVVTCCYAGGSWGGGSAVSDVKAMDSEFCANTTASGNCFGAANRCDLYRCFIHSNSAGSTGGGLGQCYAYDCVISNNTASGSGGGMGIGSSTYKYLLQNCVVVSNRAENYGGGIYVNGAASGMATNTLFAGNAAFRGGGVYGAKCITCVISNNNAVASSSNNSYGGGAYSATLVDCDVCYNYLPAGDTSKGDSYGAGANSSVLTGCRIFGNAILLGGKNQQGAGLYSCAATNSVIYENFCYGGANGVGMNGGTACGCVFSNNQANVTWSGSQIRQPSGPLVNCEFYSQSVECTATVLIENCRFWGYGGWRIPAGHNIASMVADLSGNDPVTPYLCSANIHMRNCLIVSNTANYVCKAYDSGKMTFENCTFADNRLDGTFLNFFSGSEDNVKAAEAVNCIFTRNYNKDGTSRCDFKLSGGTNVTLSNCLVGTSRSGTPISESGTVTADSARFNEGSATDPYEIKRTSPAFGKGLVLGWMTATATDVRGRSEFSRLRDGKCDIGCYQCWLDPVGFILLYK